MSRHTFFAPYVARSLTALALLTVLAPSTNSASAQAALGTPFIAKNNLSFQSSQLTRSGGDETTTMFGVVYGHRFGAADAPSNVTMVLRGSARPLDQMDSGVLDLSANVGITRTVASMPKLSLAASTGVGLMAWSDDAAKTGRVNVTVPVNAGVSYDLRVRSATITPFAMGSVARYRLRTALNDVVQTTDNGWDAYYTTGASLRLREVVLTSSRIAGEYGMPARSRWAFSAGISF
ncbi:MAG: hypothetical protein U0163_10415 [Gemmatimonadaceae bacterium]